MKSLRTCIVTGQYPPQVGGVGHSAYRVANLLVNSGINVQVVAFQKHPEVLPFDESFSSTQEGELIVHRVKVYYPDRNQDNSPSDGDMLTRYNREMFEVLDQLQNQYRYDILHAFFLYPAGFIAGLVGKLHALKIIASIRGNDIGKYAFDPLRMPFVRSALDNADYITSVATNLIELADRALTPIAHKAKTILNSVDRTRLRPQSRPTLNLNGLVIGTAGLMRYKKGLRYLFAALAKLKHQLDFSILLAGDFFKPEDEEPHMQWLRHYGLEDRTVITGRVPREQMADYLQLFDILVFPSLYAEGCPLSMLEGMALNKAIIGSRAGAIPEIIEHEKNGLLVRPGSTDDITEAIVKLAEDGALRQTLADNAGRTADQMTPDVESQNWLDVYRLVLNG